MRGSAMMHPPTPQLRIRRSVLERNIARMARYAAEHGLKLRPHTKTHKSRLVARMQIAAGAAGLTVAKVGEAQVIAAECEDLLVAYPAVDAWRTREIARRARERPVCVAVDSVEAVDALAAAAGEAGSVVGIMVDIDVGFHRTGLQMPAAALELAQHVARRRAVRLDGLFCYPGHVREPAERQGERDDPASAARFAQTLERESERLSRIVADLLDLSRLEAGGDLDENVQLDALVAEEGHRFEDRARASQLTLDVRTEQVPAVRGSERDLALMVANLIDNAIRYTPGGGTVQVRVGSSDGDVRIRVEDSGIGIPQRDLTRVLERFYRVDPGRSRRSGGTGLGLSIVRHVVENHGGSVSVESELGRGTTVDVVLPVAGPA
jgi:signal transduction histidine kinase